MSDFQVSYESYFKSPQSPQFQKVSSQGSVSFVSGSLVLTEIPTIIKFQINKISPNTPTATKKVLLDGKQIISSDPNSFELTIDDNKAHEATIVVEDKASGAKTEIVVPITVNRADIIGKLIVTPSTVGTDPFTVKFDASTTVVNDASDEVVSFSWDFGDGTPKKNNFSESIITHIYRYDTAKENGTFRPVLTIKTKKGREVTVSPETDIIVKRANQTLNINIDSHPAQVASVGDRVTFSIDFNGLPSDISRDFGDGKTLSCKSRQECGTTMTTYTQAGTYQVRASVSYASQPTIEGSIAIKIQ